MAMAVTVECQAPFPATVPIGAGAALILTGCGGWEALVSYVGYVPALRPSANSGGGVQSCAWVAGPPYLPVPDFPGDTRNCGDVDLQWTTRHPP